MCLKFGKYSLGMGDRFGCQAKAQLQAVVDAGKRGIKVVPVWNKSHREHTTTHTEPASLRQRADAAVKALGWNDAYHVDADHITLNTVDGFIECSDFFTLDVADYIGVAVSGIEINNFVARHQSLVGDLSVPGMASKFKVTRDLLRSTARKYLGAVKETGKIYKRIKTFKRSGTFITELSMDETDHPQSAIEILLILAAVADEGIPIQTLAPKFTGRFNKGVDYVGDVSQFAKEFEEDVLVVKYAVEQFGLPRNLKLSIHSGSDKFSLYAPMHAIMKKHDAGVHIKTAGTTWLEELIGLAMVGGEGLAMVKAVYQMAFTRRDEFCEPYASVIDIRPSALPRPEEVERWGREDFVAALRHDQTCKAYNPSLRQLLHVGYKAAAEMGEAYLKVLKRNEAVVAGQVTHNLLNRHIVTLFK